MPDRDENAKRFTSIFQSSITRDGSGSLLEWLQESDFFIAPASTVFHGNYEGGLLEHSLNVYDALKERLKHDRFSDYSEETVAVVALLHDLCKVNFYKKGTRNVKVDGAWTTKEVYEIDEKFPCGDHADKSIIILQNFIKLDPEEILAIRGHMGGFDNAVKGGGRFLSGIFERSRLAVHLHLADMEATYLMENKKN